MIYEVSHRTCYRYQSVVTQSQHLIHLSPRPAPRQTIARHVLLIEPTPTWRHDFVDYFGNPAAVMGIDKEHRELLMHARTTVEVVRPESVDLMGGPAWEETVEYVASLHNDIDIDVAQYALPSAVTPSASGIIDYAWPSFEPGRPLLGVAWDLTCRIFDDFTFDPRATDISTPVAEVLRLKRGVCQDFAHLALACLRAFRVPARYVSGYLLTRPPEGMPRLQGADASHAWISVWTPDAGWVDFDPTNRLVPGDEHIA
ncbi:MAG: transglutaminase N-terminal domain-containing protein, partial [Hyphomicrobiaceae bacterium]